MVKISSGDRFGRLTVVCEDESRPGYVFCDCDCGNRISVRKTSLTAKKHPTLSCGCLQKERASEIGASNISINSEESIEISVRYNTNFHVIEKKEPNKNNKSGKKGVWFDHRRGNYVAYINIHNKRIHLGRFSTFEAASAARDRAEEKYFLPIIEAKTKECAVDL